jgi:short-subunit dehydrogenase
MRALGRKKQRHGMDLRDQVIIITGASSGFGELIARQAAEAGARVVLVARTATKLAQLATELGGPGRALAVAADVTDTTAVQQMAAQVIAHFGRIDVLVNNAGYGMLDPVANLAIDAVEGMLDVNVLGALRCTQAVLPYLRAQRSGEVIVMASIAGLLPFINMGGYCASKYALLGLFETLQLELAGSGVRCAIICPGPSLTPFMQHAEIQKYPRVTRIAPWIKPAAVAQATIRAIQRRTDGTVIIPIYLIPLVIVSRLFPRLARMVMRIVR